MPDEPDDAPTDPFKLPPDRFSLGKITREIRERLHEGELLWNQLLALDFWNDLERALATLSSDDLRKIVLARVVHEHKAGDDVEDEHAS